MRSFIAENIAYPWYTAEGSFFRGFIFEGEEYFSGNDALELIKKNLSNSNSNSDYSWLKSINGVYSFIIKINEKILFATDRLRSLPLFYSIVNKDLWVGDDVNKIVLHQNKKELNIKAIDDLKNTCLFVLGRETVIKDVFQVRAAEICVFDSKTAQLDRCQYFCSSHKNFYDDNEIKVIEQAFHTAYSQTGKTLVKALRGRTAVVPLSGGADSRMIVSMLKEQGYEKVICYTYGKPNNPESEMSKAVAKKYGYEWHFIPYLNHEISDILEDAETKKYIDYAFMYSSTPHFQDYYAVRELKKQGILPKDSVFVPGHSGDIPNGNHVAELYLHEKVTKEECINNMAHFAFAMNPKKHRNRIVEEFEIPNNGTPQDYASIEEWLDTSERQAKSIVHSTRIYEFFGYEWLIPLWDKAQFDFWEKISLQWRYKRKLYYYMVSDCIPSTNDLTLKKRFEGFLRKVPVIHQIASRVRRIQNWWISPLQLEHMFSANEYFRACFFEKSTFDGNTLISKRLIKRLEDYKK